MMDGAMMMKYDWWDEWYMKWRWGMIRWKMLGWMHEIGWWWWNMMLWYDGAGWCPEPTPRPSHYCNPMSLCTGMPVCVCVCVCVCACVHSLMPVRLLEVSVHLLYSSLLHACAYQHALAYICACCMGRVSEWLVTPKVFVWILSISVRRYMGARIGGTWVSSRECCKEVCWHR